MSDLYDDVPEGDGSFICESGTVHEVDPETLAVKAVIPSIDPNRVHDQWIAQVVPWVGKPGYGAAFAPAVGSEVLITGLYGGAHTLFYLSRYNARHTVPEEFADGSRGHKLETIFRLLGDLLIEVKSQTQVLVEAAQRVDVDAPDVRVKAGGSESLHAQGNKIGFLGAEPTGKKTLPPPATDLASCIALANALRAHEIERGFAQ